MESSFTLMSSRQLRSLFLVETKKFLTVLKEPSELFTPELRDQMLIELRENLKKIMHAIEVKEKNELLNNV